MSNASQITSLDTAEQAAPKVVAQTVKTKLSGHDVKLSGKTMKIEVYASEHEGGSDPIFVGLNGVGYSIPRGVPVEVPAEVVGVLRDAVATVTSPAKAGGVTERNVPRHNFQVLA